MASRRVAIAHGGDELPQLVEQARTVRVRVVPYRETPLKAESTRFRMHLVGIHPDGVTRLQRVGREDEAGPLVVGDVGQPSSLQVLGCAAEVDNPAVPLLSESPV